MTQKLYFTAFDKAGKLDLWTTDGTTTAAVGGISDGGVSGAGDEGLGPEYFAVFGQKMIFAGEDALNNTEDNGVWLTDGTAGGTTEVGGVSPGPGKSSPFVNGNPNGLDPTDFVTFASGSKAIFFGNDAADFNGLWVTDGTTSGTIELGGLDNGQIVGKGANLTPENITAFGSNVLFDAIDSSGFTGLWVTDGTTAGTVEIGGTQNQGVFDSGLSQFEATDFISIGDLMLFDAPNKDGDSALWVTDGSANGTYELGGVDNAQIAGANHADLGGGLANAVRFGARVFFNGPDAGGDDGLWVTDGTALGTQEIGGLGDAGLANLGQHPSSIGLNPTDITVNGQKVLFNGVDALGFQELWATDGTAAGTYEIGGEGVGGELAGEAVNGVNPTSIVALGNGEAVFIGDDSSNNTNSGKPTLWVTDGTYAGTHEIGGLDNQGVAGIATTGFSFTSGIVGGSGLAYFIGQNAAGETVLWKTDGTAGGTKVVAATDGDAPSTGLSPSEQSLTMGPPPASATEITGGGQSVNLDNVPGETVDISGTNNTWDTVTGDNGLVNLNAAQAALIGGGIAVVMSGVGAAVSLSNTKGNKDSVFGTKGAVTLNGAQANVIGGKNSITFASGTTGNVVYLSNTDKLWDTVTGSNGAVHLTSAQASVIGGGDTIYFNGGTDDQVSVYSTSGNWDTVYGSGGTVIVNAAQASVIGDDNLITANSGSSVSLYKTNGGWDTVNASGAEVIVNASQVSVLGGGNTISESAGSTISLYNTNNNWDTVSAKNALVLLNSAQAQVSGGGNAIAANAGSQATLIGTNGSWDTFTGSGDTLNVNSAQASVLGGGDTIWETGGSSALSLYNTNNNWDTVNGAGVWVALYNAQALVSGGGDTIIESGASSLSLANTGGNWDKVTGSGDTDILSSAQVSIFGGGDVIWANGGSSVSLYATNGNWDTVHGTSQTIVLNNAQASIFGGGNQITVVGGSNLSLYSTGGTADAVSGSGAYLVVQGAQASLSGNGDFVTFGGSSTLSVSGTNESFTFGQALGLSSIAGFDASDTIHLSKLDWTSFSVMQNSGAIAQVGNDTVITHDASDKLTLVGVKAATLTSTEFSFS